MRPDVELITTGAELLNGRTVNRHAQWLGAALDGLGWRLRRDTTVPDDAETIRDALLGAASRSNIVILSGGLGPTCDDITRDVVAAWAGASMVMHEPSRQLVVDIYQKRGKPLNAMVERHALVVAGAKVLDNRHGLAPGEHIEKSGTHVFLMPGPPREFQGVMTDHVLPWIKSLGIGSRERRSIFQVAGIGESDIAAALDAAGIGALQIDLAYCAGPSRVTIRIGELPGHAADFDRAAAMVQNEMGPAIYAENDASMERIVADKLIASGKKLAVAESCTGGMIGQRLTAVPGISAVFMGGVIAYDNRIKEELLGVQRSVLAEQGAVSREVAEAMARGVRERLHADVGVAVTGIAGPDGGTPDKPVGLVFVSVSNGVNTTSRELRLGGGREAIREAAALIALDLLRQQL